LYDSLFDNPLERNEFWLQRHRIRKRLTFGAMTDQALVTKRLAGID
jgi:hypothetical protein